MSPKDIHAKPFDEPTITKLEIFERYVEAWLPVWVFTPRCKSVVICDFFAGAGCDSEDRPGSPLRILRTIEKFKDSILENNLRIRVILNELPDKLTQLQANVGDEADRICLSLGNLVRVEYHGKEFKNLFEATYSDFLTQPNLMFIDQNGIKEVTEDVFQRLIALRRTDFLFFVSSSYLRRFPEEEAFRIYFPDLDPAILRSSRHEDVHRIVLDYYAGKIPLGNETRLYPFSIKKGGNIYGLVFGSKHPRGVEKFLNIVWDKSRLSGEANFDIDGDRDKTTLHLFEDMDRPTKRQKFEQDVEERIADRKKVTNRELYEFALANGHPSRHVSEVVRKLHKAGKVDYDGRIGFSFDACYKKPVKSIRAVKNA